MATETKMDVSFFEKLTDGLSSFSEGVVNFLGRLFGSSNERFLRKLGYIRVPHGDPAYRITPGSLMAQVNVLEEKMHALSPAELKELTPKFRERLKNGETLDDLLPEAFAACREAALRAKNMRHFDVQILGGIALHRGNIAEMATGEGKTLVATLPAYLNALTGKGVHVVTVNDYLARRDCEWMLPIYQSLGITAGYIQSEMEAPERRKAYDCDITYGTNSEFGFDYLRDNMKPAAWGDPFYPPWHQQVQRALNYAIIDEVDNILIDEARTPLIISGPAFSDIERYAKANEVAVKLTELERKARAALKMPGLDAMIGEQAKQAEEQDDEAAGEFAHIRIDEDPDDARKGKKRTGVYFEVKEKEHTCHLTDEGVRKAEELVGVESFYTAGNMEWPHLLDNALRAQHLYKRDRNYLVMDHEGERKIIIVDEFTGRAMFGRQWSDGLHQAVEAKHARDGVKIKQETQTLATVTLQNFFRLYKKLSGMTGTAMTEANEFWKIYNLDVIQIPTNRPLTRKVHPDRIYRTDKEKWDAVVAEIVEVHETGRPILIGTTDVAKSEKLSGLLKRRGIKHELLNAKPENVAREAEIVAQAGRVGAVTISTNMAGRGTDIILGGNPETLAWAKLKNQYPTRLDVPEDIWKKTVDDIESKEKMKEEGRRVAEEGGLHIVGTERHDSRRIDLQLRGRAARQGDPGSARFYLSLQDDLMRKFAGEWVANVLTRLGMQEGEAIESKMVSRRVQGAQKKVEEMHFDMRKNLLEYDEVMDVQRKRTYGFRQAILNGKNCKIALLEMIDHQIEGACEKYLDPTYGPSSFAEFAATRLGLEFEANEFNNADYAAARDVALNKASRMVLTAVQDAIDENLPEDEDPKEWKWQEMARLMKARYNLALTDRQLKAIGRDQLMEHLTAEAEKSVHATDLSGGAKYLDPDWGLQSLCDWARQKFLIKVTTEELADKDVETVKQLLHERVMANYRQREVEFPAGVAMATYMAERSVGPGGGQRYDREGLFRWAKERFPSLAGDLTEEDFRTQPRSRLQEIVLDLSRRFYPAQSHEAIDQKLREVFEGTQRSEVGDAKELAGWMREVFKIELPEEKLVGVTEDAARQTLWNAYDLKYRPEMRGVERSLLLSRLDSTWKKHLLVMDHLRSGIGLMGYAQIDPKTEYKRLGKKEFDSMWGGLEDKITDAVFRMEEEEGFQESIWSIAALRHDAAPQLQGTSEEMSTNAAGQGEKKQEPIRNREAKVGRNDPCPCGSGKKYKNCHMRLQAGQTK